MQNISHGYITSPLLTHNSRLPDFHHVRKSGPYLLGPPPRRDAAEHLIMLVLDESTEEGPSTETLLCYLPLGRRLSARRTPGRRFLLSIRFATPHPLRCRSSSKRFCRTLPVVHGKLEESRHHRCHIPTVFVHLLFLVCIQSIR